MDGVFVGHQVSSELKYFKSIGVNCKADVHTIDTMKLMQLSKSGGNFYGRHYENLRSHTDICIMLAMMLTLHC